MLYVTFVTSNIVLRHPKRDALKNVQISTVSEFDEFNVLARFCETIPMVKSVSSFEIQRISFGFLTKITILPFLRKIGFSRVLHIYCRLFLFYFYKFFSISFDLKKVDKVREVVEQFKEIGIVPIIIILEFVS